ncbi:hypothetical protein P7M45_23100, partial [Vibrio parahaemolyticus]|nr:hypothetical protein [Vibrio parahaemolyticus]
GHMAYVCNLSWGTPAGGRGPSQRCFAALIIICFSVRDFKLEFDPLNMLKNSPKLARMSGLAKNFIE